MRYFIICLFSLWTFVVQSAEVPIVELQTTMGAIVLELNPEKAPKSVENFLSYAKEGFYEGTIFHRVINHFMVQTGGYTKEYEKKPTRAPVVNEAANGLKNVRGTVAMARTGDPDSATSQFFINVKDNHFLDYRPSTSGGSGYTVFAKVIKGMETVEKIQQVTTGAGGPFQKDVPQTLILIEKVKISKAAATPETEVSPSEGDKTPAAKTKPVTANTEKTSPITVPKAETVTTDTEKSPSTATSVPSATKPKAEPKTDSEKTTHAPAKVESATTDTEKSPTGTTPATKSTGTEKSQPVATEVKTDTGESAKAKTAAPPDKAMPAPDAPSKPDKPEAPPS